MNWRAILIALSLFALGITSLGVAQERKISRKDLPAAVEKTVTEQENGATIRGLSTELEKGKRVYEAEFVVNGHSKDILIDANGKIIEIEEEIAIDSLPANVKEGLTTLAGAGLITRVESITKDEKLVAYEAVVKTGKKQSEIKVGPDGKKLEASK